MRFRIEKIPLEPVEDAARERVTTLREEGESAVATLRTLVEREGSEIVGEILELPGLGAVLTARVGNTYQTLSCYPETGPMPIPRPNRKTE